MQNHVMMDRALTAFHYWLQAYLKRNCGRFPCAIYMWILIKGIYIIYTYIYTYIYIHSGNKWLIIIWAIPHLWMPHEAYPTNRHMMFSLLKYFWQILAHSALTKHSAMTNVPASWKVYSVHDCNDKSLLQKLSCLNDHMIYVRSLLIRDGDPSHAIQASASEAIYVNSIFPTPYAVLPLFATRLATCTGGNLDSYRGMYLWICKKWSAWEIYQMHWFGGWNLQICFHVAEILGAQTFSLNIYYGFNIEPYCLYVCVYQGCPQTLAEICRNMSICDVSGQWPPGKIYAGFILLWPGDAIWRPRSKSTLAQGMACFRSAPSHYLNQYWLTIKGVLWYSHRNYTRCANEHVTCSDTKMLLKLPEVNDLNSGRRYG